MTKPLIPPPVRLADAASIDDVYAALRGPAAVGPSVTELVVELATTGVRVVGLRTPTLPPATHTSCYWLGPEIGQGSLGTVHRGQIANFGEQPLDLQER